MPTKEPQLLTEEAIAEIEARANAATKGDWTIRGASWLDGGVRLAGYGVRFADGPFDGYEGWDARTNFPPETPEGRQASADRAFLAHARTDIPALCQTVRAAWKSFEISEAARGHDNDCYRELLRTKEVENATLRDQLAENARRHFDDARSLERQRDELQSRLAQVEKERDALRDSASLVAFQAHQIDGRIATSLMNNAREQCAKKVREYLTDCRDEETGIIEAVALQLESLTLHAEKP